jgi:hypothetical protein
MARRATRNANSIASLISNNSQLSTRFGSWELEGESVPSQPHLERLQMPVASAHLGEATMVWAGTSLRFVAAEKRLVRARADRGRRRLSDPPDREHRGDNQVAGASVANRRRRRSDRSRTVFLLSRVAARTVAMPQPHRRHRQCGGKPPLQHVENALEARLVRPTRVSSPVSILANSPRTAREAPRFSRRAS